MHLPWAKDVTHLYEARGLGGRLNPLMQPAVVVVDLIEGFTNPEFPAGSDLTAVLESTRLLLDDARARRVPVIFTTIAFSPIQVKNLPWLRKMPAMTGLTEGSHWTRVDARLAANPDELVISKQTASSFSGTSLANLLTSLQSDGVIVCGTTTSGCVRATAVDACMAGWPVFIPRECVGDRASGPHEASLFDIQAKYGEVCSLTEAITMLRASQPFRNR